MASLPPELTPQERLAITRKAIVRHMNRHNRNIDQESDSDSHLEETQASNPSTHFRQGGIGRIRHAARIWWHRHPASAALELANPLLDEYAKAHPFKLVGISAAAGAAFVLVKPWRMISASALLMATVKSSGFSNTLASMLSSLTHSSGNADRKP